MVNVRLNAEERREVILEAALAVFAEKGFTGATTRDIARSAGVSEALLYRHFPSKEDLHEAIHDKLCSHKESVLSYFCNEEPSTQLLVQIHFVLVQLIAADGPSPEGDDVPRLLIQDMLGDGKFSRLFHEQRFYPMFALYRKALDAAIAAGDLVDTGLNEMESLWFLHHVAVMFKLNGMPDTPTFEYRKNSHALIEDMFLYSLRGIGMTKEAIATYADSRQLAGLLTQLTNQGQS